LAFVPYSAGNVKDSEKSGQMAVLPEAVSRGERPEARFKEIFACWRRKKPPS
jgi:hypothetical protein